MRDWTEERWEAGLISDYQAATAATAADRSPMLLNAMTADEATVATTVVRRAPKRADPKRSIRSRAESRARHAAKMAAKRRERLREHQAADHYDLPPGTRMGNAGAFGG